MKTSQEKDLNINPFNQYMFIGREGEVSLFSQQFDELLKGTPGLITVAGDAGIGKTYLVERAIRQLPPNTFLFGKSQHSHSGSFTSFSQILNQIANHILTLPNASMHSLSQELKRKVGDDLALLASISPGISKLFDTSASKKIEDFGRRIYRVKNAVFRFFQCASRTFFPMVIYLDDVQWADPFSLDIINTLVTKRDLLNVLLVVSFRLDDHTPEMKKLSDTLKDESCYIHLKKVDLAYVQAYVQAVMGQKIKGEKQIVSHLYRLSAGNPFYIKEILRIWFETGVIAYSENKESLGVSSKLFSNYTLSDSIEALLIERIHELEQSENQLLDLLACLGGKTNFLVLQAVLDAPASAVEKQMEQLAGAGVIFISDVDQKNKEICFSHDIIYRLIDTQMAPDQKQAINYRIAKTAMAKALPIENKEVFIAICLLQLSKAKIQSEADLWMNTLLIAGMHEKKTASMENALAIFEFGMGLIPFCRQLTREYIVSLNLEYAEILCLYRRYQESEGIIKALLDDVSNKEYLIKIKRKKLYIHHYKREHKETIKVGAELVNALGVKFNRRRILIDYIKFTSFYTAKRIKAIPLTSDVKDERISEIIDTLIIMNSSAAVNNDSIRASIALTTALVAAKDPGSSNALMGYASCAYVLLFQSKQPEKTKALIDAINTMIEQTEDSTSKPTVYFVLGAFLSHWTHPLIESVQHLQKGIMFSEQLGDFPFLGFCNTIMPDTLEVMGTSLTYISEFIKKSREAYSDVGEYITTYCFEVYEAHIAALSTGKQSKEESGIKEKYAILTPSESYIEEVLLLQRLFLFGDMKRAYPLAKIISAKIKYSETYLFRMDILLFTICTLAAVYSGLDRKEQKKSIGICKRFLRELKSVSYYQPDNFYSYYALAEAEYRTHILKDINTIDCYNRAIKSARQNKNIKLEALGNLLAAKLQQDNDVLAAFYAKEAVRLYHSWGADALADKLAEEFQVEAREVAADNPAYAMSESRKIPIEVFAHRVEKMGETTTVSRFFDMMIKNGYANYCAVLVEKEEELFLKYERSEGNAFMPHKRPININHLPNFPHKMLRYVERTSEEVVLEATSDDSLFGSDTYIRENPNLNLACFPLKHQRVFFGAIYLTRPEKAFGEQECVYIKGLIQAISNKIGDAKPERPQKPSAGCNSEITKREIEILRLVKQGLSNDEISQKLSITLGTTKIHMYNILRKLNADNRVKAIIVAEEQNIL
ncbi:MAG: AAA family ATPase [Eubacteriales bacterium]